MEAEAQSSIRHWSFKLGRGSHAHGVWEEVGGCQGFHLDFAIDSCVALGHIL